MDKERFAHMLWKSRTDVGMSQEYMAEQVGVSKKTIWNWENGVSVPDLYQGIQWFNALNTNPMKYYYGYVFEELDGIDCTITDNEVDIALEKVLSVLTATEKRRLLFLLYGQHGSSPDAILNLVNAYLQCPIKDRIIQAATTLTTYRLEESMNAIVCPNNIKPNVETLDKAIVACANSVMNGGDGYSLC